MKEASAKPIVGVGRFTNPDTMAAAIRSGKLDIIGAARPSIADPFLPKKIEEGRYDEIRECVGNNICIAKALHRGHIGCTQNATAGEEFRRHWHPERFERASNSDRDVLVVGAGPAGMECAIVLGKRGMRRVHLVEAQTEIGGILRWVPRLPGLGEWARILNYRAIQLGKLPNVEVITGLRLDADGVMGYGAEIVVIATGARWAGDGVSNMTHAPIDGADSSLPHVLTPEQVMIEGKRPPGPRVVVYDAEGYFMGAGLAETLHAEGYNVELVTPLPQVAQFCEFTREIVMLRRSLHELGIAMTRAVKLTSIEPSLLHGVDEWDDPVQRDADAVVLVTHRLSNEQLYFDLVANEERLDVAGIEGTYRIGDCVAPRLIADVIFDGHRLGREIDSGDPAVPLPYRRESFVIPEPATLALESAREGRSPGNAADR